MSDRIVLTWQRFTLMSEACKAYKGKSCIYVIADPSSRPQYIGEAGGKKGLRGRYWGGNASSMDAALHGSGNLIFVAPVADADREAVENALIYAEQPRYNKRGKTIPLSSVAARSLTHGGDVPSFVHRGPGEGTK